MEYKGITATKEQDFAISCMHSGEDTKIQAPAGSGKTWLLKAGSSTMKGKGSYLAFNKAIADEAKASFPNSVDCRTGHSLAFRKVGYKYKNRFQKLTGSILANSFDIGETQLFSSKAAKGFFILDTIRRFCYSEDQEITKDHLMDLSPKASNPEVLEYYMNEIPAQADRVWRKMINEDGSLPITHDVYLKLWALYNPYIEKDYILFDEAQDANEVILDVVRKQTHAQRIFVGDKFQQIYGWRGAKNAMEIIKTANTSFLTQSFRFGQPIAEIANKILMGYSLPGRQPSVQIVGNPNQVSSIEEITGIPNVIICRTNAGVITNVFDYVGRCKIYIQGGNSALLSLLNGAKDLQNGKTTLNPELFLFKNWGEVLEYVELEKDSQMGAFVKMVDNYGIDTLISLLYRTENFPGNADLTITTAHKSKGLEWKKVKLGGDFLTPEWNRPLSQEETNLLYVSATRALETLDITDCASAHVDEVLKTNEKIRRMEEGE